MSFEVFWCDLGSTPNFEGFDFCPNADMALEVAKIRVLFSSRDSFAFVTDESGDGSVLDRRLYRVHWKDHEVVAIERNHPDWNNPRVRPE